MTIPENPISANAETLDDVLGQVHHGDCILGMDQLADQA